MPPIISLALEKSSVLHGTLLHERVCTRSDRPKMVKPASLGPFLSKAPIVKPEGATIARRCCRETTNRRYHTTRAKRRRVAGLVWSCQRPPASKASKQMVNHKPIPYLCARASTRYAQNLHACMHSSSSNHRHHMTDTRCDLQELTLDRQAPHMYTSKVTHSGARPTPDVGTL